MGDLSRNFSLSELTSSRAGQPSAANVERLRLLVTSTLQPLRDVVGQPFTPTSGYRSPEYNKHIGGSSTSQHMGGEAVDFVRSDAAGNRAAQSAASKAIAAIAFAHPEIPFDQLIWYDAERGGHVHISYTGRHSNRREILHAPAGGGYRAWTPLVSGGAAIPVQAAGRLVQLALSPLRVRGTWWRWLLGGVGGLVALMGLAALLRRRRR